MSPYCIRIVAVLATVVAVLSCSGEGIAPPTATGPAALAPFSDSTLLAGLAVSGAVANGFPALDRSAANASAAAIPEVSWVSLVPGTVPDGTTATITNVRTTQRATVELVEGGFDPQPIPASVGDALQIAVSRAGKPDAVANMSIIARPAPRIVRTRPPRGQTDAPLNTVITLVFSEPLDPTSVSRTSITLSAGASPVAGEVRVLPGPGYTVEFTPSALLVPGTTYSLTVSGVVNLAGTSLATPTYITFTTTSATDAGPVTSLTVSPDSAVINVGGELQLTATRTDANGQVVVAPWQSVTWTSSAPDGASVELWSGTLRGIGAGTVVITARSAADGRTGTARITVNPSPSPIGAIATSLCNSLGDLGVSCGLYAADPDGSNGRLLTSNPWDLDPVWSPDGTSIAFRSQRACGGSRFCPTELYVMKVDGSGIGADGAGLRSLTKGRGLDVDGMSWSPDGSRIVFAGAVIPAGLYLSYALYVMNADGSGLQKLVSGPPGGSASWPDWSPDGNKIVYNVVTRGDTSAINVVNADGTNSVRISTPSASRGDLRPHWSPDGKRIAFTRWWTRGPGAPKGALSEAFVMNADGSNVTQITHDSLWAWYPAWSPDGTRLVAATGNSGWGLMNADGGGERSIPIPCCGLEVFSQSSWRRAPATVPASVESSAQR